MSKILVSIVSMVFISLIIDVVMPRSNFNKHIRGVISLILIISVMGIIADFKDMLSGKDMEFSQDSLIYAINKSRLDGVYDSVEYQFRLHDVRGVKIDIESDLYNSHFTIDKVVIDVSSYIGDQDTVVDIVISTLGVDGSKVVISGQ